MICFSSIVAYRTPAETGSLLEESNVLNCSEENEVYEAACQSFDSVNQFTMSYHRTDKRSVGDSMNGTIHTAQLHAVPGYSCLIDEVTPLQKTESEMPVPTIVTNVGLNEDLSEGTKERAYYKRAMSDLPPCDAYKQTSDGDAKFRSIPDHSRSYSSDNLFSTCEARTHSSKLQPPNSIKKEDDSKKSMASNVKPSRSALGGAVDDCLSTSSDDEVDPNSAAAASAAAVRKAIENAQVWIKIARETMERKKSGLRGRGRFKEKRDSKVPTAGSRYKDEVAQVTCERVDVTMPDFAAGKRQNGTETGQGIPGAKSREKHAITNGTAEKMHGKDSQQDQVVLGQDGGGELEETELFYDAHNSGAATFSFECADGENEMTEFVDAHESKEEEVVEKKVGEPTENTKLKISGEAYQWEEIGNTIKGMKEWDANKLEAATTVPEQDENEKKRRIGVELREIEEKENEQELIKCQQQIKREEEINIQGWEENEETVSEEKLKECQEPIKREKEIDIQVSEENEEIENEGELKNSWQHIMTEEVNLQCWEEDESVQERLEEGPKHLENMDPKVSCEQTENEMRVSEVCGWKEHEKQPGEVCGVEEDEKQKDASNTQSEIELAKVSEKEARLNVPYDWEDSEKLLKEDHPWEGNENVKEIQKLEESGEVLKESQMRELEKSQKEAREWEETWSTQEGIKYDGEKNLEATDDASEWDQATNLSGTEEACTHRGNDTDMHVLEEVHADEENRKVMEVDGSFCEPKENGNELRPLKLENDLEEREMLEEARLTLDAL